MKALGQLKTLYYLTLSPIRGDTHEQRLESFYRHQAGDYDAFRERMLHGRNELFAELPVSEGQSWLDIGAGTGRNAERWGDRIANFSTATLLDLSSSLLKVADERIAGQGWNNVKTVHADATTYDAPDESFDLVTCCYSLTMIPNWFAVIENARRMLKPGGTIGVVDFYVAHKYPEEGLRKHNWLRRTGWPTWFGMDNVFPSPDHLPTLRHWFEQVSLEECAGKIPWLPLVRAPYYIFIGQKT